MVFATYGNSLRAAGAGKSQKLLSTSEVRNSRIFSIGLVPFQGSRPVEFDAMYHGMSFKERKWRR
jgi:hypothetical protein